MTDLYKSHYVTSPEFPYQDRDVLARLEDHPQDRLGRSLTISVKINRVKSSIGGRYSAIRISRYADIIFYFI